MILTMKTTSHKRPALPIQHEFVEFIPERLTERTLYVSVAYASAAHLCFCGCGNKVVTPIHPAGWELLFDGGYGVVASVYRELGIPLPLALLDSAGSGSLGEAHVGPRNSSGSLEGPEIDGDLFLASIVGGRLIGALAKRLRVAAFDRIFGKRNWRQC